MRINDHQNGFTLIEVLVAIAIFAIGFLAVGTMQHRALSNTTSSRIISEAVEAANAHIEELQEIPLYDKDRDLSGDGVTEFFDIRPDLEEGTHSITDPSGVYTIRWEVIDDQPLASVLNMWKEDPDDPDAPDEITISKTIRVRVFGPRNPGRVLAEMEMVKIWERDGIQ